VRRTDSTRNCSIISLFFAPIAFLIHISFVLSETVTRSIFITQIPHTKSDIPAIPPRNIFKVFVIVESVSSVSAWLDIVKFILFISVILRAFIRIFVISDFTRSILSSLVTATDIFERYGDPKSDICAVVRGTSIELSVLLIEVHFSFVTHTTVKRTFPIRIVFPSGLSVQKRFVTTVGPRTATLSRFV